MILSFFFMEFVAWSTHKYVMHGFLWKWHKDHHKLDGRNYSLEMMEEKRFEKNDLFFLIYALPAIVLLIIGFTTKSFSLVFIGVGITVYGFTYFVVHDIIIHRRFRIPFLQNNHHFFTKAVLEAHMAHHMPETKKDFHNYGLLIFPLRYFKK